MTLTVCLFEGKIDPILAFSVQPDRVQEIEGIGDHLHLSIMHGSDEGNIPLISVFRKQ
jgi:hypothetical protein